jgi:anti-anti-sigma factor
MTTYRPSDGSPFTQAICVADGDGFRIELSGEIDLACRPQLDEILTKVTAAPAADVVVDLSGVTFLSSDGLGFLSQIHVHASSGGCEVALLGPSPVALRALQITGFDQVFRIAGTPVD